MPKWQHEPWNDFVRRLLKATDGRLTPLTDTPDGYPQAIFSAASFDLQHLPTVFRLAREYEIAVCPEHPDLDYRLIGRPGLYFDLGANKGQLEMLSASVALVTATSPVDVLQQAGFGQFDWVPGQLTVTQWLADSRWHDERIGYATLSGVERIEACSTTGRLMLLQRVQDASGPAEAAGLMESDWDYLLQTASSEEALRVGETRDAVYCSECFFERIQKQCSERNFAQLLIGALGTLVWPTRLVIRKIDSVQMQRPSKVEIAGRAATDFDSFIKSVYDPGSVLPYWDEVLLK